ncbi:hypothetical protein FNQ90_07075, partial [Streptomyces alkaliphilus]|nr:hypothetical protein [Streptomyces alkaliphilus]
MTDTTTAVNGTAPPVPPAAITLAKPTDATAPTIPLPVPPPVPGVVPETFRPTEEAASVVPAAEEEIGGSGARPVDPPGLVGSGVRG